MVLAWRDKRIVKMVSTLHPHEMQDVFIRERGHQDRVRKQKPTCIVEYNGAMNRVDRLDQNIQYYPFVRKTVKWTKKFVVYLFEISLFNSYVIYKTKNPRGDCKTLLSFIQNVVNLGPNPTLSILMTVMTVLMMMKREMTTHLHPSLPLELHTKLTLEPG
jgi:hypothetical protein